MLSRRRLLGMVGVAVAGGTAGCLGQLPFVGDETYEFEATAAAVPDDVLDETGYEEHQITESVVEETVETGDQQQDVTVTNWHSEYDRALDLGELGLPVDQRLQAAIFTVLSTPQVSVLGETFNPVGDMDSEEIATMVQERYGGIETMEQVDETTTPVAGESTTVGEFETEAELVEAGVSVDLTLHVSEAVESGDDFLVAIGGYPTSLQDAEVEHIFTMMEAVEHD